MGSKVLYAKKSKSRYTLLAILASALFFPIQSREKSSVAGLLEWELKLLDTAPESRICTALAMFEATSELILFGGTGKNIKTMKVADTWAWNGTKWTEKNPAHSPPKLYCHAMAYDPERKQIVVFGGWENGKPGNSTWIWDGSDWREARPETKPRGATNAAMAFNYATRRLMLFGGVNSDNSIWEWDGANWVKIAADAGPTPRGFAGLTFDRERNEMIMFGGITNPSSPKPLIYNDTWAWNGKYWRQIATPSAPSSRYQHKMEFHPTLKKIILVGGQKGERDEGEGPVGLFSDTWTWDGDKWTQHGAKDSIQPAYSFGMGYNTSTKAFYLYLGDSLKCATRGPKIFVLKDIK
jgi:N-acetylneuraminic acid mutarotase